MFVVLLRLAGVMDEQIDRSIRCLRERYSGWEEVAQNESRADMTKEVKLFCDFATKCGIDTERIESIRKNNDLFDFASFRF